MITCPYCGQSFPDHVPHLPADCRTAMASEVQQLRETLSLAHKPLLVETDLVAFHRQQMASHREAAIANRRRAEAAELENARLRVDFSALTVAHVEKLTEALTQAAADTGRLRAALARIASEEPYIAQATLSVDTSEQLNAANRAQIQQAIAREVLGGRT